MKRILMTAGVAVLALTTVVAAQGYTFNTNLTVGSRGADVVALQTWLVANGFSIPAIESGAAAKGYFGSQTKTAVMQYQASRGIPNTGFVGPLTRGALNAGGGVVTVPGGTMTTCPAGYVCTPVPGTTNPGTVSGPTGITTPGVAGTLVASLQSTPSNGTSLSKGQEADVATYKLQAGASDMAVTSLQLDFDNRLWLYAGSIKVLDGSTVVAEKSGLTVNDFVEMTAGSQYRLTIPVNYVVARAGTKYLTVHIAMLPSSDRSSATLSIINAIFRSVDGTGVTDSQTIADDRSFSYTGSNNGSVVVTVDATSPLQGLVQVSTSNQTDNVVLAVYDVKVQNTNGVLRSLTLVPHTNGPAVTQLFGDIKIKVNGQTYSASTISSTTVAFTNLSVPLSADVYTPVTVYGKVNQDTNNSLDGAMASTSWAVSGTAGGSSNNPVVEDSSYSTMAVTSGTFVSSDLTYSASSASLSNLSATLGNAITSTLTSVVSYPVTMSFSVTAGNSTLYVAAAPGDALATSTTITGGIASSSLSIVTANPSTLSGDNATYFVVPAGSSRNFTYAGSLKSLYGDGIKTFQITGVYFGTNTTNFSKNTTGSLINYNLGTLKVTPVY
ncbi:MAG: peptidoglycan-binding domain-containing protein [Candidatus Paceibacterota bacterium]